MASGDYTKISVHRATLRRLRSEAAALAAAYARGQNVSVDVAPDTINPECCGVSMDALINALLDEREAHRERGRRYRERNRVEPTDFATLPDSPADAVGPTD